MPRNKGATLIEALFALVIGLFVFVTFLAAVAPVQSLSWNLSAVHDRDATLCLAAPLFCKWISGAANNRANPAACVREEGHSLRLQSDTDGPTGFPDGDIDESYESVVIRHSGSDLQMKIGAGSFQPVFRNVRAFEADTADQQLISINLEGEVDKNLIGVPSAEPKAISLDVYLWNFRPSLFEVTP